MILPYYKKEIKELFKDFDTSEEGLSSHQASHRLQKYGYNKLPDAKADSLFQIFIDQFKNPLIYTLLISSIIVFYLKDYRDGFVIMFVIVFNAIIGAIQEGKAQRTLAALKNLVQTQVVVMRDNKEIIIDDTEIVPGDILVLHEGDKIPADARVIYENILRIDESAITGESLPVDKTTQPVETSSKALNLKKQHNMVFRGTSVVNGNAKALVVATALDTEIGKISKEIEEINTEIPLKKDMENFSKAIVIGVIALCILVVIYGYFAGYPFLELLETAVALCVSIIPEGLPIVITLILAHGVWVMGKRHALIKKLHAVESLGQVNVIAVDKTGTITKNELEIQKVYINDKFYEFSGSGYSVKGEVFLNKKVVDPLNHQDLVIASKIALFAANAKLFLHKSKDILKVKGDPTEIAMLVFGRKVGFHKDAIEKEYPRLFEIPFDYKTKCHVVVNKMDGKDFISVVGSPESIIHLSDQILKGAKTLKLSAYEKSHLENIYKNLSSEGYRVIAFGIGSNIRDVKKNKLSNITFGGFYAMKDGLKFHVREVLEKTRMAGIKVVMITGDNKLTAESIAKEAGIYKHGDVILTSEDLVNLKQSEILKLLPITTVFANVTPEDKLKIVEGYRSLNLKVAMTGDGVNDVPSLVAADLSLSMGLNGTEVAKEASDIVLLDDNFESIVAAIEEGRNIYKSITKVIQFLFSTSIAEALLIVVALIFHFPLPLSPTQIIWLNLMTDSLLVVALAMEPKEKNILAKKYERSSKYIIKASMLFRILAGAIIMALGTLFLFLYYIKYGFAYASTVALSAMVAFQWINAINYRSDEDSIFKMEPFANKLLNIAFPIAIVTQLAVVYVGFLSNFIGTVQIKAYDWLVLVLVSLTIVLFEELRKFISSSK